MLRLSGDLPTLDPSKPERGCRSCCKEFSLFSPGKRCHHCGYHYCRTCATQGWASWPDTPNQPPNRILKDNVYTVKNILLVLKHGSLVTSAGVARLKSSEFSQEDLLQYSRAYGIVDLAQAPNYSKADLVTVITELSRDGCTSLPIRNERYYRQHSVPNNLPKSQPGCSTGILQYSTPLRPLRMTWGTKNPWIPPARTQRSRLMVPQRTMEGCSVALTMDGVHRHSDPTASASVSTAIASSSLCVICQEEEANIAIVSCGHLALCKGCSDNVMESTHCCPLCRTEISTKSQLIRIYKP